MGQTWHPSAVLTFSIILRPVQVDKICIAVTEKSRYKAGLPAVERIMDRFSIKTRGNENGTSVQRSTLCEIYLNDSNPYLKGLSRPVILDKRLHAPGGNPDFPFNFL